MTNARSKQPRKLIRRDPEAFKKYFAPGGELEQQLFRLDKADKSVLIEESSQSQSQSQQTQKTDKGAKSQRSEQSTQQTQSLEATQVSTQRTEKQPASGASHVKQLCDIEFPHKNAKSSRLLAGLDVGIPASGGWGSPRAE